MRRRVVPGMAALVVISLGFACTDKASEKTPEEATIVHAGDLAPSFSATTLDGEVLDIPGADGRLTVISFFATWCAPCREELPHLEEDVWKRFQGPGFAMLGVAREHSAEEVTEFVHEMGLTFPIAPDPSREIYSKYADAYIPRTVIVGADGRVLHHESEYTPEGFRNMVRLIASEIEKLRAAEHSGMDDPAT